MTRQEWAKERAAAEREAAAYEAMDRYLAHYTRHGVGCAKCGSMQPDFFKGAHCLKCGYGPLPHVEERL
jgi:hypothetical protein